VLLFLLDLLQPRPVDLLGLLDLLTGLKFLFLVLELPPDGLFQVFLLLRLFLVEEFQGDLVDLLLLIPGFVRYELDHLIDLFFPTLCKGPLLIDLTHVVIR